MNDGILSTVTRNALNEPTRTAATESQQDRRPDRPAPDDPGHADEDRREPVHVAERQVDLADDDHEREPERHDGDGAHRAQDADRVGEGEERVRLAERREYDDHDHDRDDQAADAQPGREGASGPLVTRRSPVWPAVQAAGGRCSRSSRGPLLVDQPRKPPGPVGDRSTGPGKRTPWGSAAGDGHEVLASLDDVLRRDRLQGVRVRQHLAVLEELGAGERSEPGLVAPLLVERDDLRPGFDGIELADADVPAEGEDLAGVARSRRWPERRARRRCPRSR